MWALGAILNTIVTGLFLALIEVDIQEILAETALDL